MELKVWVEGIQRIICGVTVNTTCQDVVYALAHATGKVGRFTLIERWRNNERLLAPNENPLKLLLKWGEYANDVQFILQRSEQNGQKQLQQQQHGQHQQEQQLEQKTETGPDRNQMNSVPMKKQLVTSNTNTNKTNNNKTVGDIAQHKRQQQQGQQLKSVELNVSTAKELVRSFGSSDSKTIENVGIVKGIPQRQGIKPSTEISETTTKHFMSQQSQQQRCHSPQISNDTQTYTNHFNNINNNNDDNNENININNINNNNIYAQVGPKSKSNTHEINLNEIRNLRDRCNVIESPEIMFTTPSTNNSNENLLDIYNGSYNNQHNSLDQQQQQLYNSNAVPTISANGALVPPPYRDPPPPRQSPLQNYTNKSSPNSDPGRVIDSQSSAICQNCNGSIMHDNGAHGAGVCSNPFLNDYSDFDLDLQNGNGLAMSEEGSESIFQATQYNELLALIKFQREKISLQQSELNKYDAEIVYLETKERDQAQELESISREITKTDQIFRQGSEQLQTLQYVEEENELVKQQEKTLKSEITLLRSKLANCETELLQCKNKIRILMDDIELEQRIVNNKQKNNRQSVERDFLIEMERIQSEIDQAIHNTDTSNKTTENLKKEILLIENAIAEKKRQVEQLVNEMKEVNLQSLTVTTSEEIKHLLEGGSNKPGSSRRIIGSPRQLENAVPTSKNPHGVWV